MTDPTKLVARIQYELETSYSGREVIEGILGEVAALVKLKYGHARGGTVTDDKLSLPNRMRNVALDLPVPDDMTNREYWLRTEIYQWADAVEGIDGPNNKCTWAYDENMDAWNTTCGNAFVLESDTPTENDMRFCTYCGKNLIQQ